jgi:predicted aspartyl protease
LKNKAVERVSQTLANDVSISTNMGAGAHSLLKTILDYLDFESVKLLPDTLRASDGRVYAKAMFVTKQDKEQESVIAFDGAGRIVFIDYFDRLFGQSRYRKSSRVAEIPFRRDGHSIVLTLRLNDSDRDLSFLLDTGADGMAIRKTLADSLGIVSKYAQRASIVGGHTQVNISSGNRVHLTDSLSLTQQNIAIFDEVRHNMDGIIGLNLIKSYITKIDFDEQKISLYNFGDLQHADTEVVVPFKMHGGLVLVPSVLSLTEDGAQRADFLFDTGADYKLIVFSNFVQEHRLLYSGFRAESMGTTVSLGHSTPVYHGTANELTVGNIVVGNVPVTLQAASLTDSSPESVIDGSIGVQFWSGYNITIDLLKKEIHLIPRG